MQPQDFHILVVDDTPENLQSLAVNSPPPRMV
jgi:CheY-like chemotaxis protein